jgi:DNA (cytosine-5)-methyltransferase 1
VHGYAPTLIQTGRGERKGQRPRYLDLNRPLGTVEAGGAKHAVVAAFLAKHYKGVIGTAMDAPIGTITAKDHHSVITARLAEDEREGAERVSAFLIKYFKTGIAVGLDEPLHTITTRHRFGLVMCRGVPVVDIGLRMVHWTELLRAQFTPEVAATYDMSPARTEGACIRLIGNSVSPPPAIALLRANDGQRGMRRAA